MWMERGKGKGRKYEGEGRDTRGRSRRTLSLSTFLSFLANMAVTADILITSADVADIFPNQYPFSPGLHF